MTKLGLAKDAKFEQITVPTVLCKMCPAKVYHMLMTASTPLFGKFEISHQSICMRVKAEFVMKDTLQPNCVHIIKSTSYRLHREITKCLVDLKEHK